MLEPEGSERQLNMKRVWMVMTVASVAMIGSLAMAQDQAGGDRANRGDRRQRMDPAQMQQQRIERIKQQLGATEEEWQVLSPLMDKVFTAQRNASTWGGWGARGGDRQGNQAESELQRASRELRSAVTDNANDSTIQERLAAYRAAREKAHAELEAARKELKEVLTPKQEAILVVNGVLE